MVRPYKTLTALVLAVVMVLSMPMAAFAELPDIQGHWAENMISSTVEKGLLEGYPDGTFRPEEPMIQAEFFTIINRSFGFGRAEDLSMPAIASGAWYAAELIKAKAQGYLDILGEGVLMPDKPISREMAAAILGKVMRLEPDDATANGFSDATGFTTWAKGMSGAVVGRGYMQGYRDDTFKPDKYISRAEVSTIMYRVVGELYKEPGVYGEEKTTTTISGNATVSSSNITLRNIVIEGDLYLTEGIGDGSITLENVTVKGTVIVGGGAGGVFLKDSTMGHMVISTPDSLKGYVSVQGSTSIGPVKVYSEVLLEEAGLSGAGFGDILILAPKDSNTGLSGNFDTVEVASDATRLSILKGTVKLLEINGTDTNVELDNSVSVGTLTVNKPAKITGNCTIGTANINSSNVTVMARPNKVNIAAGLTGVYCIAAAPAAGSSGGGGGGGSNGGNSGDVVTVESVDSIKDITVENGTSKGDIGLPGKVAVTLSDNSTIDLNVNWNNGNPAYNAYMAGKYEFSGTLALVEDIKNPDSLKAKVSVTVKEAPAVAVEIVGVVPINNITVENGTLKTDIGLPEKATVKLSDTSTKSLEVSWDNGTPEYNGDKAGTYEFSGLLTLAADIENPKALRAKVAVIVKEAEQEEIVVTGVEAFSDVNVENGTEITVVEAVYLPETAEATFSIGEPRELDIDWDIEGAGYDGNTEAVYTFEGDLQLPEGVANPQGWKAWLRVVVGKAISEEVWITAVDGIADIAVDYGTDSGSLPLPDSVGIVLSNGDASKSAGVQWVKTGYDGNNPGTYTLHGTLVNLPTGVVNSGGLKAAVKVTVGDPEPITVIGIDPIADMTVAIGTAKEAVDLPATVQATLSNGTNTDLAITWDRDASSYDGNTLGTYTFQGTLILTGGIEAADTTVSVKVTVGSLTVENISTIADFGVAIGTAKEAVGLPATVQVSLSNGTTTDLAITWDRETSSYDGNTMGTYTFQGILVLPYGIVASDPNVSVNVTVVPHTIASVAAISDFSVTIGTTKEAVNLPATVQVTLSNGSATDLAITWDRDTSAYDGNTMGTYTFQGILILPYGVVASDPNVSVDVTVVPLTVASVAAISEINVAIGTTKETVNLPATVQVTLSNGTTTDLGITWDRDTSAYDGNTLGTYNFQGTLMLPYGVEAANPTVSVNVTVVPHTVASVVAISDFSVTIGTTKETVNLPATVQATLSNGTTSDLGITWNRETSLYDGNTLGTYNFQGTLVLPYGVESVNPTVSVNVMVVPHTVVSVAAISDITAAIGTAKEAVGLPETVQATLSNGTTNDLGITWDRETSLYDGNILGTYVFQGILVLPYGVTTSNPNVNVNVIVSNTVVAVSKIDSITVERGTAVETVLPGTVTATLNNGTTTDLQVVWDGGVPSYDPDESDAYEFTGVLTMPTGILNPSGLKASVVVYSSVGAGTTLYNMESLTGIQQSVTAAVNLDDSNSLYGAASINLQPLTPVVVDANSSYCTVVADGIPGKAFSSMDNLEFSLYTPDPAKIEYFLVKFYTDQWHGIFYENGIGGWELNTGWNKIRRRASDFDYVDSVGGTTTTSNTLKASRDVSSSEGDSIANMERRMKESIALINSLEASQKKAGLQRSSALSAAAASDSGESITAMEIYVVYDSSKSPSVNIDRIGYNITGSTKILFTFDDAWQDVLTHGKPILDAKGFKATTWANLDAMSYAHEDTDKALWLMNESELASIYADPVGWDIGNHTVNHLDTLPDAKTMRSEYLTNQEWLLSKGWTRSAYHACYPSGQYSDELIDILKDIGVKSARTTVHGIQPVPTPDIYKLKCVNVSRDTNIDTPSTTEEPITDKIDRAIATGSSLMFMFHRVEPSPEPNDGGENYGALAVSTDNFTRLVDYIYNYVEQGKAEVVTISQWYDYYMKLDK